jgi:hypothetical protein
MQLFDPWFGEGLRRKQKSQFVSLLTFLLRYRDSEVIPDFQKLKKTFNTSHARRILNRAENALLRKRINQTRMDLANADRELSPEENSVLAKGKIWGKLATTPGSVAFEDIIANVCKESAPYHKL